MSLISDRRCRLPRRRWVVHYWITGRRCSCRRTSIMRAFTCAGVALGNWPTRNRAL